MESTRVGTRLRTIRFAAGALLAFGIVSLPVVSAERPTTTVSAARPEHDGASRGPSGKDADSSSTSTSLRREPGPPDDVTPTTQRHRDDHPGKPNPKPKPPKKTTTTTPADEPCTEVPCPGPPPTFPPDERITQWPTGGTSPTAGLAADRNGNMWFVAFPDIVGRISAVTGKVTRFHTPDPNSSPIDIALGADGAMWFTETRTHAIGRIDARGTITEYPTADWWPNRITAGPDSAIWFIANADYQLGHIGRVSMDGNVTYFNIGDNPIDIAAGSDGMLWVSDLPHAPLPYAGTVYRMDPTTGAIKTRYRIEPPDEDEVGQISRLAPGPDAAMWFTYSLNEHGKVGRMTPSGDYELFSIDELWTSELVWHPDGSLWMTNGYNVITRRSPSGKLTTFPAQQADTIAVGPDGNIWITQGHPVYAIARLRVTD